MFPAPKVETFMDYEIRLLKDVQSIPEYNKIALIHAVKIKYLYSDAISEASTTYSNYTL